MMQLRALRRALKKKRDSKKENVSGICIDVCVRGNMSGNEVDSGQGTKLNASWRLFSHELSRGEKVRRNNVWGGDRKKKWEEITEGMIYDARKHLKIFSRCFYFFLLRLLQVASIRAGVNFRINISCLSRCGTAPSLN